MRELLHNGKRQTLACRKKSLHVQERARKEHRESRPGKAKATAFESLSVSVPMYILVSCCMLSISHGMSRRLPELPGPAGEILFTLKCYSPKLQPLRP